LFSKFIACPGLFYNTPALDGILSRFRIPGGILNSQQCQAIANIADNYGGGYVDVTNRANLQIREIKEKFDLETLETLQKLGLGSVNPYTDHIRNIMTNPTAGIDHQELVNTLPFVKAWDEYVTANSHLNKLSAKFSVGFDGGSKPSVAHCPNDITLMATFINEGGCREELTFFPTGEWGLNTVYFILKICGRESGEKNKNLRILLKPKDCIPVLAALAEIYLQNINTVDTGSSRKARLREVIAHLGWDNYIQQAQDYLYHYSLYRNIELKQQDIDELHKPKKTDHDPQKKLYHLGIHRQKQSGLVYIGVVLPLGRLKSWQMRGLADLATQYGNSQIRLTPWQNVLITDIPVAKITEVEKELTNLQLSYSPLNINSGLVSCSGKRGCASAATDTKTHALQLGEYLDSQINLDSYINIHFTGCVKSCAQHHPSDITLLGVNLEVENETMEGYQIYLGDKTVQPFGRRVYENVPAANLPELVERMLTVYQHQRVNSQESFREFASRYDISELKQLFSAHSLLTCNSQN
jgi:ferredoxin-nitrite reductase